MIPEGRVLIDYRQEFRVHRGRAEGRSDGLSALRPLAKPHLSLHSRTLISSYEVYEALRRGVAVPFRKRDAEALRNISELKASDKGGMIFQPEPGLLNLRIETKRLKKIDKEYAGIDSVLKWMLVTCFGYTDYRNAKFGQIQVHERATETSRELLMQIKELAENMGFEVLHGIVNCLRVVGEPISAFKEAGRGEPGF